MTQQITLVSKGCKHTGLEPVKIGGYDVHLGAGRDLDGTGVLDKADYIVSLNGNLPHDLWWGGRAYPVVYAELTDYGGVPEQWKWFIERVIEWLKEGKMIVAYCTGGHGRTGTFGASLIALLEPETEDPIAAIRERHCIKAVESPKQAKAIYALRGQELPEKYVQMFSGPKHSHVVGYGGATNYTPFMWKKTDVWNRGLSDTGFQRSDLATAGMSAKDVEALSFDDWWNLVKEARTRDYSNVPRCRDLSKEQLPDFVRRVYALADYSKDRPMDCENLVPLVIKSDDEVDCIYCQKKVKPSEGICEDEEKWSFSCRDCYYGEDVTEEPSNSETTKKCIYCDEQIPLKYAAPLEESEAVRWNLKPEEFDKNGVAWECATGCADTFDRIDKEMENKAKAVAANTITSTTDDDGFTDEQFEAYMSEKYGVDWKQTVDNKFFIN